MTMMTHSETHPAPVKVTVPFADRETEKMLYAERLHDDRWKRLRETILRRDAHKCRCCGSTTDLQVHHRQYHTRPDGRWIAPWQYATRLLITYCASCHHAGHAAHKIPTFKLPR